jgi:hypothetical protein
MKTPRVSDETLIELIRKYKGFVTAVCRASDMSRQNFYKRLQNNTDMQDALADAREEIIDLAESKLIRLIEDLNPQAIMFALKTIGRDRGYIEKQEIDQTNKTINIIEIPKIDSLEPTINEIRESDESEH